MPRRVVIFFSDTGGGHRASALALQAALERQHGDKVSVSTRDFIREATPWPWSKLPEGYQAIGRFPSLYKMVYDHELGNRSWRDTRTFKMMWFFSCERILDFLERVLAGGVDLIVSVHPLVHHLVLEAAGELSHLRHVPVATVVTDLGSAHLSWFDPRVDAAFVPSEEILRLALHHGLAPRKIHLCGLPVREGFWQADRISAADKLRWRKQLGLHPEHQVVLLMGGGEGFGNIVQVAISIGDTLARIGRGQLVVICGRNAEVRSELERWPWKALEVRSAAPHILGFVPNIDEYMSAATCLVTKAGPGSIAEAMIKGLPCLLTSFVPGQEEGNITFVTDNGAGAFVPDANPERVAETVAGWLGDAKNLERMALNAQQLARPRAALDIARRLGDVLLDLGQELLPRGAAASQRTGSEGVDGEVVPGGHDA